MFFRYASSMGELESSRHEARSEIEIDRFLRYNVNYDSGTCVSIFTDRCQVELTTRCGLQWNPLSKPSSNTTTPVSIDGSITWQSSRPIRWPIGEHRRKRTSRRYSEISNRRPLHSRVPRILCLARPSERRRRQEESRVEPK